MLSRGLLGPGVCIFPWSIQSPTLLFDSTLSPLSSILHFLLSLQTSNTSLYFLIFSTDLAISWREQKLSEENMCELPSPLLPTTCPDPYPPLLPLDWHPNFPLVFDLLCASYIVKDIILALLTLREAAAMQWVTASRCGFESAPIPFFKILHIYIIHEIVSAKLFKLNLIKSLDLISNIRTEEPVFRKGRKGEREGRRKEEREKYVP